MRKSLPFASFLLGTALLTASAQAQTDQFAYAITDLQQQGANWSYLRKLNLQTGEYSSVLLNGTDASLLAFDATTKKQFPGPISDARFGNQVNAAFGTNVAALAYDKRNNRLYYTPMFFDQLRYIDLKTMKVFYVADQPFAKLPEKNADQTNIITRMVIAADGNGYAMTNDGTHLIQFSTGKKLKITDLGSVVDDPANKNISIHNSCSSFGGDMVADDNGNLIVISARNNVFKINIETKVATHLGVISGLPSDFTVNGAAVTPENKIIVNSAMEATSAYTVDPATWAATTFAIAGTVWHSSDLANSNLLTSASKSNGATSTALIASPKSINTGDTKIQTYPNPVTNNEFVVQFSKLAAGNYNLQVTDVMGRLAVQQIINVNGENQAQPVKLNPNASKGIYLLKVVDANSKIVFSSKIVVQ
jgi:hypothetical protein